MTYGLTCKIKEAEAIRDGIDISTPWLSAEAELMGLTLEQMAQKILQAKEEWEQAAIVLECQRLKAKNGIRNASESSEIYGIIEQVKKQFQM